MSEAQSDELAAMWGELTGMLEGERGPRPSSAAELLRAHGDALGTVGDALVPKALALTLRCARATGPLALSEAESLRLWVQVREAAIKVSPSLRGEEPTASELVSRWALYLGQRFEECRALAAAGTPAAELYPAVNLELRNAFGALLSLCKGFGPASLHPELLERLLASLCVDLLASVLRLERSSRALFLERLLSPLTTLARLFWTHHADPRQLLARLFAPLPPSEPASGNHARLLLLSLLFGREEALGPAVPPTALEAYLRLLAPSVDYILLCWAPHPLDADPSSGVRFAPQIEATLFSIACALLRSGFAPELERAVCLFLLHPHPLLSHLCLGLLSSLYSRASPRLQARLTSLLSALFRAILQRGPCDRTSAALARAVFARCAEFVPPSDMRSILLGDAAGLAFHAELCRNLVLPFSALPSRDHLLIATAWLERALPPLSQLLSSQQHEHTAVLGALMMSFENVLSADIVPQLPAGLVAQLLHRAIQLLSDDARSPNRETVTAICHIFHQCLPVALSSPATLLLPIFKLQLQTLAINPCYLPTLLTLSSLAGLPLSSSLAPPCLAELSQLCRKTFLLLFSSPEWLVQVHTLQAFKSFALTFPDGNVTTFMPPDMRQRFVAHLKAIPISSTPSHVDPDQICKEHHIQMARPSNRNHTHGQPHDHSATQEAHSVPLAERRRLLLQAAQACGELLLEFQGLSQRVPVQELKKDNSQEAQRFRESVDGLKQAIGTLPIFHS